MRRAIRAFQEERGMTGDGQLGMETWVQLMSYSPTAVNWAAPSTAASASALLSAPAALGAGRFSAARAPASASLSALRCELCRRGAPNSQR
jgi:hypothetical protein